MSNQDDGGPAFPHVPSIQASKREHGGMSLRDWFAGQEPPAKMLADLIDLDDTHLAHLVGADPEEMVFILKAPKENPLYQQNVVLRLRWLAKAVAMMRYILADAMIAERSKE